MNGSSENNSISLDNEDNSQDNNDVSQNNAGNQNNNDVCLKARDYYPDLVRAYTPIILALAGTLLGVVALGHSATDDDVPFSLASTAIAGAAGLAQQNKQDQ